MTAALLALLLLLPQPRSDATLFALRVTRSEAVGNGFHVEAQSATARFQLACSQESEQEQEDPAPCIMLTAGATYYATLSQVRPDLLYIVHGRKDRRVQALFFIRSQSTCDRRTC